MQFIFCEKVEKSNLSFTDFQGNFSVVKSPDEYSIQVTSQRGVKDFQYDQVFMEDTTQEKVFEDTNVSDA